MQIILDVEILEINPLYCHKVVATRLVSKTSHYTKPRGVLYE